MILVPFKTNSKFEFDKRKLGFNKKIIYMISKFRSLSLNLAVKHNRTGHNFTIIKYRNLVECIKFILWRRER